MTCRFRDRFVSLVLAILILQPQAALSDWDDPLPDPDEVSDEVLILGIENHYGILEDLENNMLQEFECMFQAAKFRQLERELVDCLHDSRWLLNDRLQWMSCRGAQIQFVGAWMELNRVQGGDCVY